MQKNTPTITAAETKKVTPVPTQQVVKAPQIDTTEQNSKQQAEPEAQEVFASKQSSKENSKKQEAQVVTAEKPIEKPANNNAVNNVNNEAEHDIAYEHVDQSDNDIIRQQNELPSSVNVTADVPADLTEKPNETDALASKQGSDENGSYKIYPVTYKEINTNDDDNSLHVGVFDLNKTKVKTLFKKAGRVFNNRSNDLANEDGKLQVANFEIETKKQ